MSRNLISRVVNFAKILLDKKERHRLDKDATILSMLLSCHGIYTYSTLKNDTIKVVKKYKMNRNGFTDFMIIDEKGRHFNVNNSIWYWKWDAIEDWHTIKENENIEIKYYGFRIPLLGTFPNIVSNNVLFHINIKEII